LLARANGTEVIAWVRRIHTIEARVDPADVTLESVENTIVRCPDPEAAGRMIERIEAIGREGDSCGGVIECLVRRPPVGLGMPVFDKLEADLAKAVMSLPATKGVEIGSGFAGTLMKGSEHNDAFLPTEDGRLHTATNNSGGIQGGISNGEEITLRVAFKPTATIRRAQRTVDGSGAATTLEAKGRHDPCVLPRAVPMVEAMVALVLADHLLLQQGQCSLW
jgi:chorismate synthase